MRPEVSPPTASSTALVVPANTGARGHRAIAAADATRWQILQRGSKSFGLAAWLLPDRVRRASAAVYAYCRQADDAIDEAHPGDDPLAALWLQLDRIYTRSPAPDPVERGFCEVVNKYGVPRHLPNALLEGFLWDVDNRRYQTIEQLCAYCVRVASTVGVMMSRVMAVDDPLVLARACDLGIAMQLTNIARDVGEDARRGRIYLPIEWLQQEGLVADELLRRPRSSAALGRVVKRLLAVADEHYEQGDAGIGHLPRDCRLAIRAARLIYADIGRVIAQNGYDTVSQRAYTTLSRKLWLLGRSVGSLAWRARPLRAPPSPAAEFLLGGASDLVMA